MMIKVEIFIAPDCGNCGKARHILEKVVDDMGRDKFEWREINVLQEIDYAVALGVLSTPSIAIQGQLVFTALPSETKLKQVLLEYSAAGGSI